MLKFVFGWALAVLLGVGFWAWVGAAAAWGLLRKGRVR